MALRDYLPAHFTTRGSVEHPLMAMQRELDRMFEGFGPSVFGERELEKRLSGFQPRVDLTETAKEFVVTAEIPGMDEKDLDLSIRENSLVLKGEKKSEIDRSEGEGRRYVERSFGSFQRVIPLVVDIDEDNIEASYKKGVLTVKLPKSKDANPQTKKITIRS